MKFAIAGHIDSTWTMVFNSNYSNQRVVVGRPKNGNASEYSLSHLNSSFRTNVYEHSSQCVRLLSINRNHSIIPYRAIPDSDFKCIWILVLRLDEGVPG